jgi:hypothetical protein
MFAFLVTEIRLKDKIGEHVGSPCDRDSLGRQISGTCWLFL